MSSSAKTVALFNNKGGVGKTSLVYHLAWMYAELGIRVLVADLDPQANVTTMFLDEESLFDRLDQGAGIMPPIRPLLEGTGGIGEPQVMGFGEIGLLAGDLSLSQFEDELSIQWGQCLDGHPRAFRVVTAFRHVVDLAAKAFDAELVLLDVGPNLGSLNRAALVASDHVLIPLAPDLFSLKGLENLGPQLRKWRSGWRERLVKRPAGLELPSGGMTPVGYVVMQHAVRLDRPVKAYGNWMARIPGTYRREILGDDAEPVPTVSEDPNCLASLKHFRSLMPMAQEARKPMFLLRPADGAIGGHAAAVHECYRDFEALARELARRVAVALPG